jgi:cystathionine beta-synthase
MSEGLFVGGSSGSALSGALKYLHTTPAGRALASDPNANIVVVFPDGVRNYISKPWFLDVAESEATAELKVVVKDVVGRPLDQPGAQAVKDEAAKKRVELEAGQGVDGRERLESSESGERELVGGEGKEVDGSAEGGLISDVLAKLGIKAQ